MIRVFGAIAALILVLAAAPAVAETSPFAQPGQQGAKAAWPARTPVGEAAPANSEGLSSWWQAVLAAERELRRQLAGAVRGMTGDDTLTAAIALMTVSFLYGVIHAVGPGHGKAVISSYVLANKATLKRGIALSFLAGLLQAISAVSIFLVLVVLMNAVLRDSRIVNRFDMVSALAIAAAGLWFLIAHVRRLSAAKAQGAAAGSTGGHEHHAHDHGEACSCGHSHAPDVRALSEHPSLKESAAIVFAVGIRPCTGALMVLLMSRQLGVLWAGIVATFVMALGTSITVATLASLAAGSRAAAVRLADGRWTARIYDVAALGGAVAVLLVGVGLFWDALGPQPPF